MKEVKKYIRPSRKQQKRKRKENSKDNKMQQQYKNLERLLDGV